MRKIYLLLCLSVFLISCEKKTKENSDFDFELQSNITIPSTSSTGIPINRYSPDIETDIQSNFEKNDTRKELVKYIYLEEFSMTISSPGTASFDFAESIDVYIDASGVDEKLLVSISNLPAQVGRNLILDVQENVDFKDFLSSDKIVYRVNIVNNKTINQEIEISISSSYNVKADVYRE